jgi:protein-L-isoaspartate(D-aspartate) O-methyltransferase
LTGWTDLAARLADQIAAQGHLSDPAWRDAFTAVPRHGFVPRFLRDDGTVVDGADAGDRDEWLAAVYSDTSLTTQTMRAPGADTEWPTSSSTRPSLMAHMLHLLDAAAGHRVLEIGTGTGYHTALLCHRLGDTKITSIDIHPDLVQQARDRLASLGYEPHLVARDGAAGVPERAPFDRIIATCAVPTVPRAWVEQLTTTGVIVADVRGELSSNLAVLHKIDNDTVRGRFLETPGHFMWLRASADNPLRTAGGLGSTIDRDNASIATTNVDPAILDAPGLRFLLQHLSAAVERIWSAPRNGVHLIHIHSADGSWAEIDGSPEGRHAVTQGPAPTLGPRGGDDQPVDAARPTDPGQVRTDRHHQR